VNKAFFLSVLILFFAVPLFAHNEDKMVIPLKECDLVEIWKSDQEYPVKINLLRDAINEQKEKVLPIPELQKQKLEVLNKLQTAESPEEITQLILHHIQIEQTATLYSRNKLILVNAVLILIISLFVITTIWLAFISNSSKHKAQKERILNDKIVEAQERERQRIAQELHDTITQDIRTVLLFVRELKENDSNKNLLEKIENLETQNLKNLRGIIQNLASAEIESEEFGKLIQQHCASVSENRNIPCSFFAPLETNFSILSTHQKLNIFRIIQEAVNNALKHANPTSINIIVRQESKPNKFIFFISDDGCGIEASKPDSMNRHYGLLGMKYRADLLQADFQITSSSEMGTEIKLVIPV